MADAAYTNEQHWREIGGKTVFTIGAIIEEQQINGKWHWVVIGFEDDTFWDGMTLDVNETADTREGLVALDAKDETHDGAADQADYLLFGHNDGEFINIVPQD